MKSFIILSLTYLLNLNLYAEENIILTPDQAQGFAIDMGHSMSTLAGEFKAQTSKACDLYQIMQYKLTHTKVMGEFKNSRRLQYRIDWYKNPEVDLFKICYTGFYSDVEYRFLMLHSHSMKKMQFL